MSYLRQVEGMLNQGKSLSQACQEIGVTEQIYFRWIKMRDERRMQREQALLKTNGYVASLGNVVFQPIS